MEIILEKKDKTTATIKVNLKETDYLPKIAEKLKEYSKKVNLKGFRPGKVPPALIEKMYGKSIKIDEINHLLSHSVQDYIKDNKIQILGDPIPDRDSVAGIDWDNQKEFNFNYNIGLVPEFKVELSDKVKITKYDIEVEDKVINETLENLRNQYGKMTNPEVSEEGDFVYGELKEVNGDFSTQSLIPTNKVKKGEVKKFTGLKKEDKVAFDIEKVFEDAAAIAHATGLSKEEAEKKSGKFELTVTNISRSEPAPLDQEFFDRIFGKDAVKSEEEFLTKLRDTIKDNYDRESDNLLNIDIQKNLVEKTSIELPDSFLKEWSLTANEGKITKEQIDSEYEHYLRELKWSLIRNKIGEDHDVKVENDDVIAKTKEMILQQFGNMPMSDEMSESLNKITDNYLKGENGKNYMKMFEQVFYEKVISMIKEKIKLENKKVNVEEFKKAAGI